MLHLSFSLRFVFREFTLFLISVVVFSAFRASLATQMTMDVLSALAHYYYFGAKVAKCLSARRKLTCSHEFSLLAVPTAEHFYYSSPSHTNGWAFALENRLTSDINEATKASLPSGWFFHFLFFALAALVCQSFCVCMHSTIVSPFDTPPLT